jgi:hypothetical protein
MSRITDYQTLLNRGRKAGLNTRELYSAMASRPCEGSDVAPGQADANGYVCTINEHGHRVYRPAGPRPS